MYAIFIDVMSAGARCRASFPEAALMKQPDMTQTRCHIEISGQGTFQIWADLGEGTAGLLTPKTLFSSSDF